jgi:hypothetical protein
VFGSSRRGIALVAVLLLVGSAGCGSGKDKSSAAKTTTATPTTRSTPTATARGKTTPARKRRLVPNPRKAVIERTVERFVGSVERSDAAAVCRLLGRPRGTLEGCAAAVGIDLRMFPSSEELSISRVSFHGKRASARLAGGQTFTLRRAARRWLISGLRQ